MSIELNRCVIGDCRKTLATLPEQTFACCVCSPPYWGLRDYGHADQLGLERTPEEYVAHMVGVFALVRRVLRDDGTLWLNLGDSYASGEVGRHDHAQAAGLCVGEAASGRDRIGAGMGGRAQRRLDTSLRPKNLVGIPWRVAFALQADGWYLRSAIIWHKPNPMPESCGDRPTTSHEYVFLLAKSERYHFDADAIAEPVALATLVDGRIGTDRVRDYDGAASCFGAGTSASRRMATNAVGGKDTRNTRTVWTIASQPYDGAHFATMPPKLAERCILAGCPLGGAVLDPFFGSGTTGQVAEQLGRQWLGCELNPAYGKLAATRTAQSGLRFSQEEPA